MSIRARLLGFFGLIAAGGVAAFFALWLYGLPLMGVDGMYGNEYRRATVAVEAAGDKQRDLVEMWFEDHRRELRLLSSDEALARAVESFRAPSLKVATSARSEAVRRLTALKESSPASYRSIQVVAPSDGSVMASTTVADIPPDKYPSWLREAAEPGMTESVRIFSDANGPHVMVMGQINRVDAQGNSDGTLLGLLVADIALDAPFLQSETSMRQALGEFGSVLLVDRDARVLLKQSSSQASYESHEVAGAVVSGTEGTRRMTTAQGTELIAVFRYLHLGASDELSIAVTRGTDDALAVTRASFVRMSALMGLIFLLSMGLVIFAANHISSVEGQIRSLNANLELRIQARTQELASANDNLQSTLDNLAKTRDDLVRSEKLAALGALVAGVAHELNTPIGTSLTVASTMSDQSKAFQTAMAQGIKRSTLDAYLAATREGVDILMHSLQKAVDLVGSFKRVAVDQASDNYRTFPLGKTAQELLMTLRPSIRKTSHAVDVDIPDDIVMSSFPGPLGQVITNLVNNALVHGFRDGQQGVVLLHARKLDHDAVEVIVSDGGVGIPQANLTRVFDPFFTTKLGQGGSGLGLNIVYNIVTKTLRGTIRVESAEGQGTRFIMHLPLVVEDSGLVA